MEKLKFINIKCLILLFEQFQYGRIIMSKYLLGGFIDVYF